MPSPIRKIISVLALLAVGAPAFSRADTAAASTALNDALLNERIEKGLGYFEKEQDPADGSFTKMVIGSSVMYGFDVIFLYEYLGLTEQKKDIIQGLMRFFWSQQKQDDGGMPGYPGGPSNISISAQTYLAAKIAGEDELSPRMLKLEHYIKANGGWKHATMAMPYLMLFQINKTVNCLPAVIEPLVLALDRSLPWMRVIVYPFTHLYTTGRTHFLSPEKFPKRLGTVGVCPARMPHPARLFHPGERKFWSWINSHMNDDGTLFDYTPTTVPGLMALSTGSPRYAEIIKKGIATLESFQVQTPEGLYQSSGDAAVGETTVVINGMLDMGISPEHPILKKAEEFLWSVRQPKTGGFGMSKHNQHFPDSDDTSDAIYALKRIETIKNGGVIPADIERKLDQGLDFVLGLQNKDGGFATWEPNRLPFLTRILSKGTGVVLSESVTEHTARSVLNLSMFMGDSPRYRQSYERGMRYLLNKQNPDGSYTGTWFVDYLFGTSMALAALGSDSSNPAAKVAIEKAIHFILQTQKSEGAGTPDGGFSESPESYIAGRSIQLPRSSPTQTGLVMSALLSFLETENYAHWSELEGVLDQAAAFLVSTQAEDGVWHDKTWTGVTFPKVEYLIYQNVQEMMPLQALGMYRRAKARMNAAKTSSVSVSAPQRRPSSVSTPVFSDDELKSGLDKAVATLESKQNDQGAWSAYVITSSVNYNCQMIFLYEFLNRIEEKRAIVDGLMEYVWSQQLSDGSFPAYTGGPASLDDSVESYLAAKFAGENELSPRMRLLEHFIRTHGGLDKSFVAKPFLMLFGIDTVGFCVPGFAESMLLGNLSGIPKSVAPIVLPLLHILASGHVHRLSPEKYPHRLGRIGTCPLHFSRLLPETRKTRASFYRWLDKSFNPDGTLFEYVPTSVFGLMALSLNPDAAHQQLLEKGIATLETYRTEVPVGIKVGFSDDAMVDTFTGLRSLLNIGVSADDPGLKKAEQFLYAHQLPGGGFGFASNNVHNPDSDDSANTVFALKRLQLARDNGEHNPKLDEALKMILGLQNKKDGGFGAYETFNKSFITRFVTPSSKQEGFDMTSSSVEPSARIALTLALFKNESPAAAQAMRADLHWLVSKQNPTNGSYAGVWITDYIFTTAQVLAAFGGNRAEPGVSAAIEKCLGFIFAPGHQHEDGGFSESPESFVQGKYVPLPYSSPAQTGEIATLVLTFLRNENDPKQWQRFQPALERAIQFLISAQKSDGLWHDATWTATIFPKYEYLIYPNMQEFFPTEALGIYQELEQRWGVAQ